jgi:hypothetical protein
MPGDKWPEIPAQSPCWAPCTKLAVCAHQGSNLGPADKSQLLFRFDVATLLLTNGKRCDIHILPFLGESLHVGSETRLVHQQSNSLPGRRVSTRAGFNTKLLPKQP